VTAPSTDLAAAAGAVVRELRVEALLLEQSIERRPRNTSLSIVGALADAASRLNELADNLDRELDRSSSNAGSLQSMLRSSGVAVTLAAAVISGLVSAAASDAFGEDSLNQELIEIHGRSVDALAACGVDAERPLSPPNLPAPAGINPSLHDSVAPEEEWRSYETETVGRAIGQRLLEFLQSEGDPDEHWPSVQSAKLITNDSLSDRGVMYVEVEFDDARDAVEVAVELELPPGLSDSVSASGRDRRLTTLAFDGLEFAIEELAHDVAGDQYVDMEIDRQRGK